MQLYSIVFIKFKISLKKVHSKKYVDQKESEIERDITGIRKKFFSGE